MSTILTDVETCVDRAIAEVGPNLVIGAPLGLGKPVQLLNAFYDRVAADPSLSLHVITALCLEVPKPSSEIEAGLADPILARLFGDYEEFKFLKPLKAGALPANVRISEVYFKAGSMKNNATAQQNYISSNYTHIARDMLDLGINVITQLVAAKQSEDGLRLSLSCNPDITLELLEAIEERDLPITLLAQVHDKLPFMEHDAEVSPDAFKYVVENDAYNKRLFAVPNAAVPLQDYAAALHASSMIVDGGTLQIGIGSLGDAITHACILRHQNNEAYRSLLADITREPNPLAVDAGTFDQGLYVSTEMFVNGMMHLIEQGIVKRRVYDNLILQQGLNAGHIEPVVDERLFNYATAAGLIPRELTEASLEELKYWGILPASLTLAGGSLTFYGAELPNDLSDPDTRTTLLKAVAGQPLRHGRILHGGFFLGPRDFYQKLRDLGPDGQESICMTGVRRTNQLLLDYPLYCAQRTAARFINTGMKAALNGTVASDALEDGTVISGVGGQYNFVAMAHDLPGAHAILCIRSTRGHGRDLESNIVTSYGYATIPKHLRDVVVTEYGVALLRGQSDSEVIKRLINIADSRFQLDLLRDAKETGKVEANYRIPESARHNTPERLKEILGPAQKSGLLPRYPLGTDLTDQEIAMADSLRKIKALSDEPGHFIAATFKALLHHPDEEAARPFLERLHLDHPETPKEFIVQQLLLLELEERGFLKVG
ncbi:MAG: acetyl-CoA hydrolase/transferase C-terminal domain-containing protein [Pseudomonadota bacterium]